MSDRKGTWKRKDRVVLGPETAKRGSKLGYIGEHLAVAELSAHGFTEIKYLNHPKKNHRFADIYAERNGEKFWISVKTRNKYQNDGTINYCYKISPKERAFALDLEQNNPGTMAACIGVSVVVSENSCLGDERPNTYSCYFTKLRELTDRQGMGMRECQLPDYDCLAKNEAVPIEFDVSDCENVFQRRGPSRSDDGRKETDARVAMTQANKLKRDIDTVRESIRLDWLDLASKSLTVTDHVGLRNDIARLADELGDLLRRMDALPPPG